jgi:hypothetical protein
MATSTGVANKSLKLFKIALASTGIGLIVVALGSLVAALASTQRGMDAVNRVIEPVKETLATLFGIIQDVGLSVFDKLKEAVSNPKQSLIDLGKAIKQNIVNRFQGALDFVKASGALFVSTFKVIGLGMKNALAGVPLLGAGIDQEAVKKDLEQAKDEAIKNGKAAAQALIAANTGISKDQQDRAIAFTKTLTQEGKKRLAEAIERGKQIADLEIEISEAAITLNREVAAGNRAFEEQKEIAQNILKTDKERLAAVEEAKKRLNDVATVQQEQVKREIELATIRTKANDTDREAFKELADLQAKLDELEAAEIKKRILLGNLANTVTKQRNALNKKAAENTAKELEKLEKARLKLEENDLKRSEDKEKEKLENTASRLQLENDLILATQEKTDEEKFQMALDLEKKLGALRVQQNNLQAESLLKKEAELQNKIAELKKQSSGKETVEILNAQDQLNDVTKEKEKIQGEELTQIKLENKINEAEILGEEDTRLQEIADEKKTEQDEKELEDLKVKEENIKQIKNAAVAAGEQFVEEAFKNQNRRIDEDVSREIDALNLKREAGEISEAEFNKSRLALDKKAFQERKKLSQVQNTIDFAVAAGKTLASFGFTPAGVAALIPLGITAATQAAIIASQKFADGGIIHGASHAQGGVNVRVGGSGIIEAEGGEAIINKRSTSKHLGLLSAINQDGGGVALASPNASSLSKFANGGIATAASSQSTTIDLTDLENRISTAVGNIKVQNVASETTGVANRVQQIEDSASF